jgi:hypothetical protein
VSKKEMVLSNTLPHNVLTRAAVSGLFFATYMAPSHNAPAPTSGAILPFSGTARLPKEEVWPFRRFLHINTPGFVFMGIPPPIYECRHATSEKSDFTLIASGVRHEKKISSLSGTGCLVAYLHEGISSG